MCVFYKQASWLYSLIYALMLVYKKRALDTPIGRGICHGRKKQLKPQNILGV